MSQPEKLVSQAVQSSYDDMYTDQITEWREFCGKTKAKNILSVCGDRKFSKVLECGAGEGSILKFLDDSESVSDLYALEIADSAIAQIKKRNIRKLKEAKKFNGYQLPYEDNTFDIAYCSHVLEHVEHPRILLRELKRVSKLQVFEVPLEYSLNADKKVENFLAHGHVNIYTPTLFNFLLKTEGYEVLEERLTDQTVESIRFNWYKNMGKRKTLSNELRIRSYPLRCMLRRLIYGKVRYDEYWRFTYTCLAQGSGDLKIFA